MIVAGGGDADAEHVLIIVHRLQHGAEEQQELGVLIRRLARLEQVHAGVGADRPVVVLAAAVYAGEGFFMQQAYHAVLSGNLLHQLHGELIVIGRDVGSRIHRGQLMLTGRDFVVLGLRHDAELPELFVQLRHEGGDTGLDRAEVVIFQLLSLRGSRPEERSAGVLQILSLFINALVDQEILLLRADCRFDRGNALVAEETDDAHALAVDGLHRAQQRRFLIQRLAAVGAESRGDAQDVLLDEGIGGRIPGGVASGLKGGAQAA